MIQLFHTRLCFSRNDVGHGQNTCVKIEYQYLNGVNHMLKEIYWRDNKRIMYSSCPTSISYSRTRRDINPENILLITFWTQSETDNMIPSWRQNTWYHHIKQINNRSTPADLGLVTPIFSHDDHFNFFTVPFLTENGVNNANTELTSRNYPSFNLLIFTMKLLKDHVRYQLLHKHLWGYESWSKSFSKNVCLYKL